MMPFVLKQWIVFLSALGVIGLCVLVVMSSPSGWDGTLLLVLAGLYIGWAAGWLWQSRS